MESKNQQELSYEYLQHIRKHNPAWRLLYIDNSPLILSFLYNVFIKANQRSINYSEIITKLDDYLFHLHSVYGELLYPKSAKEYIEDWAHQENAFLRIYYPPNKDDPDVDINPSTEQALLFIQGLEQKQFIGTESRLLQLFQLIREMVNHTETDPQIRLLELQQKKKDIELEIKKVKAGNIDVYDTRQIKERYMQIDETALQLLGDFRQVEYNFRMLDRDMRERITLSEKSKGNLLDEIFLEQDSIKDSDQGRSFSAFWEYLMSPTRQDELKEMLQKIFKLPEVKSEEFNSFLPNIDRHLLDVGEKVYRTYNLIAEQLRKFLDNQTYLENKRIMALIKSIEKNTIEIKHKIPQNNIFSTITDVKPEIDLVMSKPLFSPPKNPSINEEVLQIGETDVSLDILYNQNHVDEQELLQRIQKLLQCYPQVSLRQIIEAYPLCHGLAEIITYLHIASKNKKAFIDDTKTEVLQWLNDKNMDKQINLPNVIFTR